jgi:phosphomannomutase
MEEAIMGRITFGTEGWRAVLADQYTFANVRAVARATGRWFLRQREGGGPHGPVAVGHDTRFMGDLFAQATADELAACGLEVYLSVGSLPTPALDYYVVKQGMAGGVMLTASHNPAIYNGFKVKGKEGCSIPEEEAKWIEGEANRILQQKEPGPPAETRQHARFDVRDEYVEHLLSLVDTAAIKAANLVVVGDCMHGAGGGFFDTALQRVAGELRAVRTDPDPTFEGHHPEPLGPNLAQSVEMTADPAVAIGVATDGDADRFGMMAHGEYVDVQRAIVYILYHLLKNRGWKGKAVRAVNVTSMFDHLCEHFGVEVVETSVGFKNIAGEMLAAPESIVLAVEESGGFGIRGHIPDRDGSYAALMACEARAIEARPVRETLEDIFRLVGGPRSFDRLDLTVTPEQHALVTAQLPTLAPATLAGQRVASVNRIDGAKYFREDGTWVMLRLSGTEPLIRIYAEGKSPEDVQALLAAAREAVMEAVKVGAPRRKAA